MKETKNEDLKKRLNQAVEEIRQFIRQDGGDIRVVSYDGNQITIQFLGNCMHCSLKNLTLNTGIKAIFKKYLPGITTIKELAHE